jgi:hypothetical protein
LDTRVARHIRAHIPIYVVRIRIGELKVRVSLAIQGTKFIIESQGMRATDIIHLLGGIGPGYFCLKNYSSLLLPITRHYFTISEMESLINHRRVRRLETNKSYF